MKIEYLCDNMIYVEPTAKWIYDEFIDGIRDGVSYENILISRKNSHKHELPVIFIALIDDKCAGTVALVENDLKYRDHTPWLAALYVDNKFRSQGIGEKLVECVKSKTRDLGYKELFLRTEYAGDYYRKLGWTFVESCTDEFNIETDVYKFKLL